MGHFGWTGAGPSQGCLHTARLSTALNGYLPRLCVKALLPRRVWGPGASCQQDPRRSTEIGDLWLPWENSVWPGWKGQICRASGWRRHHQARWSVWAVLVPAGVSVSGQGYGRGEWGPPALLFMKKSPNDPCPSREHSKISKQAFFRLLLLCYISAGLFMVLCFYGWGLSFLSPSSSPRA